MGRFLGFLVIVLLIASGAFYIYQRNIAPIPITATDLEKGGNFSADERTAMKAACATRVTKDSDKVCGCVVEKSATSVSRFDRLVMTATLQGKLADVVALSKGLIGSGVPAEKVKAAEDGNKERVKEILKSCNVD